MKKGLKITAITVGSILVLMLLLPFAFQGKMEKIIKTEGNKMLNAQFDFEKLGISLFRNFPKASVTLNNFWLKGTGEFEKDTLVQAGEVTVALNLFSLFGNSGYDISKITLEDTKLHAIVLPNGKVNWDVMKPDSAATEAAAAEEAPFKMKLQELTASNLTIIYDDRQAGMLAQIDSLEATCSGDLGSDRTLLKVEAKTPGLSFKMGNIPFLSRAVVPHGWIWMPTCSTAATRSRRVSSA